MVENKKSRLILMIMTVLMISVMGFICPEKIEAGSYYTVNFNRQDGTTGYSQTMYEGQQLPTITRDGYTFDGWYTQPTNGSKVTYVTGNMTVFAHWTAATYRITFDLQTGAGTYTKQYKYGDTLPDATRTGYNFDGWYTSGGVRIKTVTQTQTLYAHWSVAYYSVTFNPNNGSSSYTQYLAYGTQLSNLSWSGHTFDGWYTAMVGGDKVTTVTSSQPLVAHWSLISYNTTFYPDNGTAAYTKAYPYGTELPTPSREGYTFEGWYTSNGTRIYTVTQDRTVYARWKVKSFTITFNPNNGTAAYSQTLDYGTTLPNLSWGGHTFDGWYTAASGGERVTTVTKSEGVVAHWTLNSYNITFYPQRNNESAYTKTLKYGEALPALSWTGHTFNGWYTAASNGTQVKTVTQSQTVYAHWTINKYTVTFNPNNGQAAYKKTLDYGTTLSNPEAWTGHTFNGWYTKPSEGDKVTKVTGTQTVFAHWTINKYTITFNPNHDKLSTYTQSLNYGTTLPKPSARTGYTFAGWYTAASGGTQVTTVSKAQTVYAHWTVNSYTVTFNPNNAQAAYEKQLNYGTTLPNPAAWTGHTFDGWYTKPSGGDRVTKVTGTQTVFAHWTLNQYTITFNPNHDSLSTYTKTLNYGAALPNPSARTGYTFAGWYTAASGGTQVATVSKAQTVYAHWTVNSYTVTFNPNNAQAAYEKQLNYGATLPNPPAWTGHTFAGWYTKPSGGDKVTKVTGKQTVFAHWTINQYTITFDPNHDNLSTYTKTLNYGTTLPNPSARTGYTFAGWYTAASGGTQVTTVSKTQKVYAHWTINKYTITFNPNHDSLSTYTKTLNYGAALPNPSARTGYKFAGWYTAASSGTQVTTVSKTQTVYAHWTVNSYTITFDPNHDNLSTYTKSLNYGAALPNPSARTGYTFAGWYTAASGGTRVTKVSQTQKVYAHWTVNKYTITFDPNHDNLSTYTQSLNYGTALPNPSARTGYTFTGWFTAASGGTRVTKVSKTQTVYAHWQANTITVKFDANGGTKCVSSMDYVVGSKYGTLPGPTAPSGYSFDAWYTAKKDGTKITSSSIVSPSYTTLYALYNPNTYTVKFDSRGGSSVQDIKVIFGKSYGDLKSSTKSGYTFGGWYTEVNGGTKIASATTVTKAYNHTLYARWISEKTYTVWYKDNFSSSTSNYKTITVHSGNTYGTLPAAPTRNGFEFAGWYTNPVGGQKITSSTVITKEADHAIYAHWKVTVTFPESSDKNFKIACEEGSTISIPSSVYRSMDIGNKALLGWSTQKGATSPDNGNLTVYTLPTHVNSSKVSLYAVLGGQVGEYVSEDLRILITAALSKKYDPTGHYIFNQGAQPKPGSDPNKDFLSGQRLSHLKNLWVGDKKFENVGCGLLAVYNALVFKGNRTDLADIIYYVEDNGLLMGVALSDEEIVAVRTFLQALLDLYPKAKDEITGYLDQLAGAGAGYNDAGSFGTNFYKIGQVLMAFGSPAKEYSDSKKFTDAVYDAMGKEDKGFILCTWNDDDFTSGGHYIFFHTSSTSNTLTVYNNNTSRSSGESMTYNQLLEIIGNNAGSSQSKENHFIRGYEMK